MTGLRNRLSRLLPLSRKIAGNEQLILSILALAVGAAGGGAVILFRQGIAQAQNLFYGSTGERLFFYAQTLPWWQILLAPTLGGLLIGMLVHYFLPDRRPHGVADIIEASALGGGRMSATTAIKAAVINAVSIGAGASVGREGPAVHIGATLGGWLAKRLRLTRALSRTLLGCGVACAVAASFNAPIAGALFASEVVVGHYALSAFAPIVISSVTGTAISNAYFGDFPAFIVAEHSIASFWEFPVFAGLGLLAGLVAMALMQGIVLAADVAGRTPLPPWIRPAAGGAMVGILALMVPQVLGVGYGVTEAALQVSFSLALLIAIGAAKIVATAISLGFGFGGGVFSPSLVIGAMLGGAYGIVVASLSPELTSGPGAYTIVGMGAVAAAVLGAPISTTLIVFEMTGGYAITMAVMVAVVFASLITSRFHGGSFFAWQLERRGLDLKGGFESALLRALSVRQVMSQVSELVTRDIGLRDLRKMLQQSERGELFVVRGNGELFGTITLADLSEVAFDPAVDDLIKAGDVARTRPPVLSAGDDLEAAMKLMHETGESFIAVVEDKESMLFLGSVHERDVMSAYNRALVERRREELGG